MIAILVKVLTTWDYWQRALTVFGPFLGFFFGWALFELTERRKVRIARAAVRQALIAELEHIEVLLSSNVGKYAHVATTPADVGSVAKEIRWFMGVGRARAQSFGVLENDLPEQVVRRLPTYSDEQLIGALKLLGRKETVGTTFPLPVIDSVLAGRTSGFTGDQIQALSAVRWQAHLLEQDAKWMAEFLRLTLTLTDPTNYDIAVKNHEQRTRSYALRVSVTLRCVRTALAALGVAGASPKREEQAAPASS